MIYINMLVYEKELAEYDTLEKVIVLARALEIDVDYYLSPYDLYIGLHKDGTFKRLGIEPESEADLHYCKIDDLKIAIWNEMQLRRERRKLEKLIHGKKDGKFWFVTVGLDDKIFTDKNEAEIINPLVKRICDTPGLGDIKFVVEKFRRNDGGDIYIHRHIHMLFESNLAKSKIVQFLFQKAKKYVASANFVDVKPDPSRSRLKYIMGEKVDEKLKCVEMDREWRKKCGIIEEI